MFKKGEQNQATASFTLASCTPMCLIIQDHYATGHSSSYQLLPQKFCCHARFRELCPTLYLDGTFWVPLIRGEPPRRH